MSDAPQPFATLGDRNEERRPRTKRARLVDDFEAEYQRKQKVLASLLGFTARQLPGDDGIEFVVNILTGQIAGKNEWDTEWLRVRAVNAIRWLDKYRLSHWQINEILLSDLPAWLFQPSEEDPKVIHRLTRKAKQKFNALAGDERMAKRLDAICERIGAGISAIIMGSVGIAISLGVLGILVFGWKQLF
jgi:hypothetical protein